MRINNVSPYFFKIVYVSFLLNAVNIVFSGFSVTHALEENSYHVVVVLKNFGNLPIDMNVCVSLGTSSLTKCHLFNLHQIAIQQFPSTESFSETHDIVAGTFDFQLKQVPADTALKACLYYLDNMDSSCTNFSRLHNSTTDRVEIEDLDAD